MKILHFTSGILLAACYIQITHYDGCGTLNCKWLQMCQQPVIFKIEVYCHDNVFYSKNIQSVILIKVKIGYNQRTKTTPGTQRSKTSLMRDTLIRKHFNGFVSNSLLMAIRLLLLLSSFHKFQSYCDYYCHECYCIHKNTVRETNCCCCMVFFALGQHVVDIYEVLG